jgi:geranylgeranyl diphosphate synthase type 3
LQKRTTSLSLKLHTVNHLKNHTKSFTYTRSVLQTIYAQIEEEVKSLGGNELLEKILGMLGVPEEVEVEEVVRAGGGKVNGHGEK